MNRNTLMLFLMLPGLLFACKEKNTPRQGASGKDDREAINRSARQTAGVLAELHAKLTAPSGRREDPAANITWERVRVTTLRAGKINAIRIRTRELHCASIQVTVDTYPVPKNTGMKELERETLETNSLQAHYIDADVIWADEIQATEVIVNGTPAPPQEARP